MNAYNKNDFEKTNLFWSFVLFAPIYYFFLFLLTFLIIYIVHFLISLSIFVCVISFCILAIIANIAVFYQAKLAKKDVKNDLLHLINDSYSTYNQIFDWIFSLPPPLKRFILFFWRILQFGNSYGPVYNLYLHRKDWDAVCDYQDLSSSKDHDAIIIN